MADNENIFTFDTRPFTDGIKKVSEGITSVQRKAGDMAKGISSGVVSAVKKIGTMVLAFKGVKAMIDQMPEIGQAFKIAKDVIMKNLLFPLRQAIFPLLQRFLNWVRDNRAMFVKWGQTLANIFQSVVSGVKMVIDLGKKLAWAFQGFIEKTFGIQIKSFNDLLNIITFKLAVTIEFLKALFSEIGKQFSKITEDGNSFQSILSGIVGLFGDIASFAIEIGKSFWEGFGKRIGGIKDALQGVVDAFKKLIENIFTSDERLKDWKAVFEFLGNVAGTVLTIAFENMAFAIDLASVAIGFLMDGVKWLIENLKKIQIPQGLKDFFQGVVSLPGKFLEFISPQNDVIVTSGGKVVPVNSQDDIMAFKPGGPIEAALSPSLQPAPAVAGAGGNTFDIDLSFPGMQIVLQEGTVEDAQRAGETIVETIRTQITREYERQGVK